MCLTRKIFIKEKLYYKLIKLSSEQLSPYVLKNYFKKATRDIIVYKELKLVGKTYITPYQKFLMQPGMHYYQTGKQKFEIDSSVDYDLLQHSYCLYISVYEGLHAYLKQDDSVYDFKKAIIPKGSLYLEGNSNEIVTDNLILL